MSDMDLLAKLLASKGKDDDMDDHEKSSKMGVLQALKDEMGKMIGGGLGSVKKVTVAAPDEAGLKEGLDKAQDLISQGVNVDDDSNPETQDDDDDAMSFAHGGMVGDDHEHEAEEVMSGAADMPGAEDDVADGLADLDADDLRDLVRSLRAQK